MESMFESRKIQLWSDRREEEFAVKLSNEAGFRAASNSAVEYTKLVDEAEYFRDLEYDWQFLLNHWTGVKNGSTRLPNNGAKEPQSPSLDLVETLASIRKPSRKRVTRQKPRPPLKCHFCMLSYNTERERREHELEWHSDKRKKVA